MATIDDGNIRSLVREYLKNGTVSGISKGFPEKISDWDVSQVTNMSNLFSFATKFNEPLDKWNVSNVTNMRNMFEYAKQFNQPLNKWNVSKVTNMSMMFTYTKTFNQPLDAWDVSNVTDMSGMFTGAEKFNQPLDAWDVSNVSNMSFMFAQSVAFNQPLNSWNVYNVTDMRYIFNNAKSFNQSTSSWQYNPRVDNSSMIDGSPALNARLYTSPDLREPPSVSNINYDECLICADPLNNDDGPGPSANCFFNCNDVVTLCENGHRVHRGCALNSCAPGTVDTLSQMNIVGYGSINQPLARKNQCPICTKPLLVSCDKFKTVPRVPTNALEIISGGKHRIKRTTKTRKYKKGKRKSRRKNHGTKRRVRKRCM